MGGAVIAWKNKSQKWMAQRIDANGAPHWGEGVELGNANIDIMFIEPDGAGGCFFVWYDQSVGQAQYISNSGSKMWGSGGNPLEILGNGSISIPGGICSDGSGNVFVSYAYMGTQDADVGVQKITASGLKPWGNAGKPV
ncbi:MAG: hypothetical protein KF746_09290 [Chitinophagaceae bacterium]|nr:hypothetical protein [Chitinophagaceae bacterium]